MWFRKQTAQGAKGKPYPGVNPEGYLITDDMLIRGTVSMRRGKPIRQIGVTVQGSTVLVTTGDTVNHETFEALLAVGALAVSHPHPHAPRPEAPTPPPEEAQG